MGPYGGVHMFTFYEELLLRIIQAKKGPWAIRYFPVTSYEWPT